MVFWSVLPHGKYVKQFLRIFNEFSMLDWLTDDQVNNRV